MGYTSRTLEIRLFGRFELRHAGAPIPLASRPGQSLLAYLALTAGTQHRREQLAGMLWPESTEAGARGYLRAALGQAANVAARTPTFLGERYHRIARRRGTAKAQVAVARSILVIIWHLLGDPAACYTDLGHGYHATHTDTDRKIRNHIRQIQALGFTVALTKTT